MLGGFSMNKDRQIKLKNAYCQLIIDLGVDYDGCSSSESLKLLIDELVDYARKAINNDDKAVVYVNGNEYKENILMEKIKD